MGYPPPGNDGAIVATGEPDERDEPVVVTKGDRPSACRKLRRWAGAAKEVQDVLREPNFRRDACPAGRC